MTQLPDFVEQHALLAWISKELGFMGLGKKAIQKLVYNLQYVIDVPTGYNFRLYIYGPFSRELAIDLDFAEMRGVIQINYHETEGKYVVNPGARAENAIEIAQDYIKENLDKLFRLKNDFGGKSAHELELFTTLHYIYTREQTLSEKNIIDRLISLKPKYSIEQASRAFMEVRKYS